MSSQKITSVDIAVRVYPDMKKEQQHSRKHKLQSFPDAMFVFDTETRVDATQKLTFGCYRFFHAGKCLEEGLFYAPDLPQQELTILQTYVMTHLADTAKGSHARLRLLTLQQFVDKLHQAVYKGRAGLVGFNLPFDLSRIAFDCTKARGRFAGGFALELFSYIDQNRLQKPDPFRPRIGIKQIDSKRALKGFTGRKSPDQVDLIPEGSETGEPESGYVFRGHFQDLRTLAFALTDRSYSLESACEAFRVEHGKQHAANHGSVTEEYIDYNRRDVLATYELAVKLLEEYGKHPISLQVTKAYSPASIGKAYLREMGIEPILQRQPDFPEEYLGYAQSSFFGGRASAHIRKVRVPVVYTDFLSMYPTVNSLMNLWKFVIAQKIKIVKNCQEQITAFLNELTAESLFHPDTWKKLTGFVRIIPDGDILPSRGKYNPETNDWQIGINHLYSKGEYADNSLWFSLPDIAASVILTGRVPKIVDAFLIEAIGTLPNLKPVKLRGDIEVDPRSQDFFKVVIEERKRLDSRTDLSKLDKDLLSKALKVLANAASYGIYAEMNRQEKDQKVDVTCYGIDSTPFTCRVTHPEAPGEYCFPPLASLITGAARLMLALLEHSVADLGGTYAMEDTDSMAIVATKDGGLVPCAGGPYRTSNKREAIRSLSWKQAKEISTKFEALNPYDPSAVPGSVLKIEKDNFDPETGQQRQLFCFAISAKRYPLFVGLDGQPVIVKDSQHGLGHLLNPIDPKSEDRDWIKQVWLNIVRESMGLPTEKLGFEETPAIARLSVSSPAVLRPLGNLNQGKPYSEQIKPFNFGLTCFVKQLGHPIGADPERFHLIAPYESNSQRWLKSDWIDQYTGKKYRITTDDRLRTRNIAYVKTYGDILREYEFHPESKCADSQGNICGKQTIGLLQRRHVQIQQIKYIGKESNALEEVESGLIHSAETVYTEYVDPKRDEWEAKIRPALNDISLSVLKKETGLGRRTLIYARTGEKRPHPKNQTRIKDFLKTLDRSRQLS